MLDSDLLETESTDVASQVVKKPNSRKHSRSFFYILDNFKQATILAANYVHLFCFLENPVLNGDKMEQLLIEAWTDSTQTTRKPLELLRVTGSHVSKL